jgi:hypothetical protein
MVFYSNSYCNRVFFNAILPNGKFTPYIALIFALPFAIIKILKEIF